MSRIDVSPIDVSLADVTVIASMTGMSPIHMSPQGSVGGPVSYTHLDVYKRQAPIRPNCTRRIFARASCAA